MSLTLRNKFFAPYKAPQIVGLNYVFFLRSSTSSVRYSLTDEVTIANTGSFQGGLYDRGTAAGNATYGFFVAGDGNAANKIAKYFYATNASGQYTAFGVATQARMASAGNGEMCLVALGTVNSVISSTTRKYVYADDTSNPGLSLSAGTGSPIATATGNSEFGIFRYTSASGATDRYEFASNTKVAGPIITTPSPEPAGAGTGNGNVGLIVGNQSSIVNMISFAANTCTLTTSLPVVRESPKSVTGNVEKSVFNMGGTNKPCSIYRYADATTFNTAQAFNSVAGPGVCANPSGVNV